MLGGEGEKLGQALLDVFSDKSTREAAREQMRSVQAATEPTRIGEQVREAGGITMGVGAILGIAGVTTLIIRSEVRRGIDEELRRRKKIEELSFQVTPTQGGSLLSLRGRF